MIRAVVIPHLVEDTADFSRLQAALHELGFSPGEGWNDQRGTGAPFLAAQGAIELFQGQAPIEADLLVEVEDVNRALEIARKHQLECSAELDQTHWRSTYFVVAVGERKVAFFQFNHGSRAA
jgi:hypothetical protein